MNPKAQPGWIKIAIPTFFLLISVLYTYPLVFLGPLQLYGLDGDIDTGLHRLWCLYQNRDWFFLIRHWDQLNAPWGWNNQWPPQRFFDCVGGLLSGWLGPVLASNWLVAAAFPLSGWFFFLLAFELTGSIGGSLLGGFLFMFSPWHFSKACIYPEMAAIQWVPLYGLALVRFYRKPGITTAIWAGMAFFLLFNYSFVIGFMAGFGSALMFLFWARAYYLKSEERKTNFTPLGVFILFHVLSVLPALWDQWVYRDRMNLGDQFTRFPQWTDFIQGTERWYYFFLPTYYHPLWGDKVNAWMLSLKPPTCINDDVVNPGYVAWLMALIGVWMIWKNRELLDRKVWIAIVGLGVVSGLLCLNPAFGKVIIPWLNVPLYCLFPTFRVYARFGLLVSLSFCLLSALAFSRFSSRTPWKGPALLVILFLLAGFELYCPTSHRIYDMRKVPPEYIWLKDQPGNFIAAEYPICLPRFEYEPLYLLWQTYHGKRLFNLDFPRKDPESVESRLRQKMSDFTSPLTVRLLRDFGIRYILAHKINYLLDQHPERDPAPQLALFHFPAKIPGLRLVEEWNTVSIYEVLPMDVKKVENQVHAKHRD